MKNQKTKKIIAAVVAVLVIAAAVAAVVLVKAKLDKDDRKPNDEVNNINSQNGEAEITKGDEKKEISIKNSGRIDDLYTVGDTDYLTDTKGIHKVTSSGKTTLTNQKTTSHFSIINDKIYYGVEDKIDEIYSEGFETDFLWINSSCWRMNLDGSGQEKIFTYPNGCGYVIYVDDNVIIYAEDTDPAIHTDMYSYFLYKYDLKTKKSTLIDSGKVSDADGSAYDCSVDNFIYSNGSIYYNRYDFERNEESPTFRYDIADDKVYNLNFESNESILVDDNTILFLSKKGTEKTDEYGVIVEYSLYLNKLNTTNNKSETIKTFENTDNGDETVALASFVKSGDKYYIYWDEFTNEKISHRICNIDVSTWKVTETSFNKITDPVYLYESIENSSNTANEIVEYKNGKRTVLVSVPESEFDVRNFSVGKNIGIYYFYDYDKQPYPENMFECNGYKTFNIN